MESFLQGMLRPTFVKKRNMSVVNNSFRLALDIRRGQWLVADAESLLPIALDYLSRKTPEVEHIEFVTTSFSSDLIGRSNRGGDITPPDQKTVVVIPIHGTITKYDTCAGVGTMTISSELLRLAADRNIVGFVLDIDSGGGACNAIPPMVAAINKVRSMGKPIIAHCDFCASAAYWIASQCDAIFADNSMSEFGSIGVMTQIVDNRENRCGDKTITIYATESKDKNLSYRKALDGDFSFMQAEMTPIVQEFHSAVKQGRANIKAEEPGVLSGAVFRANEAINLGMANAILDLEGSVENVFVRATYK